MTVNEFYIYAYLDPRKPGKFIYDDYEFNFEPFYIGKGKGKRYLKHLQKLSFETNPLRSNKINKIISSKLTPIIIKLHSDLIENDAYKKESEIIKKIGRIDIKTGSLTNLNDGGIGGSSNLSDESRYKLGAGTRGKTYEEIYGDEKAQELKEKRIFSNKHRNTHKIINRNIIESIQEKYLEITTKTKYNSINILTSPENDVYITRNLLQICKDLKLHRTYISKLCRGDISYYKGWEGKSICSNELDLIKNELYEKIK